MYSLFGDSYNFMYGALPHKFNTEHSITYVAGASYIYLQLIKYFSFLPLPAGTACGRFTWAFSQSHNIATFAWIST